MSAIDPPDDDPVPEPFDDSDRRRDDAVDRIATYLNAKAKLKTTADFAELKRLRRLIDDCAPQTPSEWAILKNLKRMRGERA